MTAGDEAFRALMELNPSVIELTIATILGMFLGLEREWSQKTAGIRTFALICILGTVFAIVDDRGLLIVGGVLVIAQAVLLAVRSFIEAEVDGLSLTTSVSMLVTYSVGVLVGYGYVIESVTVAVLSSLMLVLKRELHEFAWGLSKEEMRSAVEFSILAFVIYPLLPNQTMGPWNSVQPRIVWLLVIAISAIGFVNYVLVRRYESRGVAFTGFFGGLVNSTAVIAEMGKRAATSSSFLNLTVGAILLANAAMAVRNAILVIGFVPDAAFSVGIPLGAIAIAGIGLSLHNCDWSAEVQTELTSPFSLRNALTFGGLFLLVLVGSAGAESVFGATGFVASAFFAGMVSSGTATTTAVSLVTTGQITSDVAVAGVISGTAASILVKVVFAATIERSLVRPVLLYSAALIAVGTAAGTGVILLA